MTLTKDVAYKAAKWWHNMGINVIPVVPNGKLPAANVIDPKPGDKKSEWGHLLERRVTPNEIDHWWNNGHNQVFNIGLIHGEVSSNFVSIDIDKDSGIFEKIRQEQPYLTQGMIEQSGSGQGYHIPVFLKNLPDFGWDERQEKPKGNKTWKTDFGNVNIRARFCQTVVPPSIHPSGNPYKFIQKQPVLKLDNLTDFTKWLDTYLKETAKVKSAKRPEYQYRSVKRNDSGYLWEAVRKEWNTLAVFNHFGLDNNGFEQEGNGEIRILGNQGLLVDPETQSWYCHGDQEGGGPIEAWAFCRFGNVASKQANFRLISLEMALESGIDIAQYYRRGDEKLLPSLKNATFFWESQ